VSRDLDVLLKLLTSLSDTGSIASTSTRHMSLEQVRVSFLRRPINFMLVTVAERSRACTAFARSVSWDRGFESTQAMDG
jgi:hypothetical protein